MKYILLFSTVAFAFLSVSCAYLIKQSDFRNESAGPISSEKKSCRVFSADRKISIVPTGGSDIAGAGPLIIPIPWSFSKKASHIHLLVEKMVPNTPALTPDVLQTDLWTIKIKGQTFPVNKIEHAASSPNVASIFFEFPNQEFDQFDVSFNGSSRLTASYGHSRRWEYAPLGLWPVAAGPRCD